MFAHARIGLNSFQENHYVFPGLFLVLVFIKIFHSELYSKIKSKQLDFDQLVAGLSSVVPKGNSAEEMRYFIYLEALLVYLYYNSVEKGVMKALIEKDKETGIEKAIVKSGLDSDDNGTFIGFLQLILQKLDFSRVPIDHLLNRVDLIESFIK